TEQNRQLIERLREHGVNLKEAQSEGSGKRTLEGKTFVVTGTLENYTRDGIHDRIKKLGGRVTSSVSAKTDYLVAGEEAGSKLNKAKQLGVTILTESDFDKLAEDGA